MKILQNCKNALSNSIFAIFILSISVGCGHGSKKEKSLWVGAGFSSGAAIGAATAPSNEKPEMHALYWGSLLAVGAAILIEFYHEREAAVLKSQNQTMEIQLNNLRNSSKTLLSEGVVKSDSNLFNSKVSKGTKYRLFEVNDWEVQSQNEVRNIKKRLELTPP